MQKGCHLLRRSGETLRRLGKLLWQWLRHAQQLFHFLIGLTFLFLALGGVSVSILEWRYYQQSPAGGVLRLTLVASFTVLLIVFGLYSFLKARSVR